MTAVQIISLDISKPDSKPVLWGTTNSARRFLELVQYFVDNVDGIDQFYAREVETGRVVKLIGFAETYGIRKRSFDERLKDKKTWNKQADADIRKDEKE